MMTKYYFKIVNLFLVVIFSFTSITQAAPACYKYNIPEEYGKVTQRHKGNSDDERCIIHIQDAHSNFDAQKNIANIICSIVPQIKTSRIPFVGIEGAFDEYDLKELRDFPIKKARKRVGEMYVKEGKFIGAELASMISNNDFTLYGLEDKELFLEDFQAFYQVALEQNKAASFLQKLDSITNRLKKKIFNERLSVFDKKATAYETNQQSLIEYAGFLYQTTEEHNIELIDFISLFQFKEILIIQQSINFEKVDEEIKTLSEEINTTQKEKYDIDNYFKKYVSSNLSQSEMAYYLRSIATKEAVTIQKYGNLQKAFDFWNKYALVNIADVMKEILSLNYKIRNRLATNSKEKELINLCKNVSYLKRILTLKAIRDDVEFLQNKKDVTLKDMAVSIARLGSAYNIALDFNDNGIAINELIRLAYKFYTLAEKRDTALLENLLKKMEEEDQTTGVLVAGGYHTDRLVQMMKEKQLPYVTIVPRINNMAEDVAYMERMVGSVAPIDLIATSPLQTSRIQAAGRALSSYWDRIPRAAQMRLRDIGIFPDDVKWSEQTLEETITFIENMAEELGGSHQTELVALVEALKVFFTPAIIAQIIQRKEQGESLVAIMDDLGAGNQIFRNELFEMLIKETAKNLGEALSQENEDVSEEQNMTNVSYWLDQVKYAGDNELRTRLINPSLAEDALAELYPDKRLYIQNNRHLTRKGKCSVGCWFCYAQRGPLQGRLQETNPMEIADAKAVVEKAIEMGFTDMQFNGEDTLDDLESFWELMDVCLDAKERGKDIKVSFFTGGIRLVALPAYREKFFEELAKRKERFKNLRDFTFMLSWDPEKVSRLKKGNAFQGKEEEVFKVMAEILYRFKQTCPEGSLSVDAHDLETTIEKESYRIGDEFHKKLRTALSTHYSSVDYSETPPGMLTLMTPESVDKAAQRGRVLQFHPVEKLFRKMAYAKRSTCSNSPFFDLAMGEIVTCIRRQEYPRRAITAESFVDTMLAPYLNPRSRHLFMGDNSSRSTALVKQLGFALALDPLLGKEMQVSFEEVESFIFSKRDIMTQVELLYLLQDMFLLYAGQSEALFRLQQVPHELKEILLSEKLLKAFCLYYAKYAPALGEQSQNYRDELGDLLQNFERRYERNEDTTGVIADIRHYLTQKVMPYLDSKGIMRVESSGMAPEGFSKGTNETDDARLPNFQQKGIDVNEQVIQALSADSAAKRRVGFNFLGLMAKDDADFTQMGDRLHELLSPNWLTEDEQMLALALFEPWGDSWYGRQKRQENFGLIIPVLNSFIFDSSSRVVQLRALRLMLSLDDNLNVLGENVQRAYFGRRQTLFEIADTVTKIRLLRRWVVFNILSLEEASLTIADLPAPENADELLEEIDNWDNAEPFMGILRGLLTQVEEGYKLVSVMKRLAKTVQGRQDILRYIETHINLDESADREMYLDILAILLNYDDTTPTAISRLMQLPMSYFEEEKIFIHMAHGLYQSVLGVLASRSDYEEKWKAEVMMRCIEGLSAGDWITSALKKYLERIEATGTSSFAERMRVAPAEEMALSKAQRQYLEEEISAEKNNQIKESDTIGKEQHELGTIIDGLVVQLKNVGIDIQPKAISLLQAEPSTLDSVLFPNNKTSQQFVITDANGNKHVMYGISIHRNGIGSVDSLDIIIPSLLLQEFMLENIEVFLAWLIHEMADGAIRRDGTIVTHAQAWQIAKTYFPQGVQRFVKKMVTTLSDEEKSMLVNEYESYGQNIFSGKIATFAWRGLEREIYLEMKQSRSKPSMVASDFALAMEGADVFNRTDDQKLVIDDILIEAQGILTQLEQGVVEGVLIVSDDFLKKLIAPFAESKHIRHIYSISEIVQDPSRLELINRIEKKRVMFIGRDEEEFAALPDTLQVDAFTDLGTDNDKLTVFIGACSVIIDALLVRQGYVPLEGTNGLFSSFALTNFIKEHAKGLLTKIREEMTYVAVRTAA